MARARRLQETLADPGVVAAYAKAGVEVGCNWVVDASRETSLVNAPDHRKIVVVDGRSAFVGGINFSADHLGDFGPDAKQDYAVQVRGPIVTDLQQATLTLLNAQSRMRGRGRAWWRRAPQRFR